MDDNTTHLQESTTQHHSTQHNSTAIPPPALHRKATFSSRMAQLKRAEEPSVEADVYVLEQQRYAHAHHHHVAVACHMTHDPHDTGLQQQCWMHLVMLSPLAGVTRKTCASLLLASVRYSWCK